jgi:N-methylhydantoinase A
MQREFARPLVRRLSQLARDEVEQLVGELEIEAHAWLDDQGFSPGDRLLGYGFGMRYFRQGYELPVPHPRPNADANLLDTLMERFVELHEQTYQFRLDVEPELVVVRCVATGKKPSPAVPEIDGASAPVEDAVSDPDHRIYWDGEVVDGPVYERNRLGAGHEVLGPAVIEQEDSTTLVHPGTRARVDRYRNLLLERI